ncbi:hypothetical protein PG999_014319 [Apiospora kogelbergensis]|uniref:Uncharacterized protein n=1 Tax=Apiospora kogelbergensis TaxID=1337665 RepID=A0AAW0QIB9_9PEZI
MVQGSATVGQLDRGSQAVEAKRAHEDTKTSGAEEHVDKRVRYSHNGPAEGPHKGPPEDTVEEFNIELLKKDPNTVLVKKPSKGQRMELNKYLMAKTKNKSRCGTCWERLFNKRSKTFHPHRQCESTLRVTCVQTTVLHDRPFKLPKEGDAKLDGLEKEMDEARDKMISENCVKVTSEYWYYKLTDPIAVTKKAYERAMDVLEKKNEAGDDKSVVDSQEVQSHDTAGSSTGLRNGSNLSTRLSNEMNNIRKDNDRLKETNNLLKENISLLEEYHDLKMKNTLLKEKNTLLEQL